MTGKQNRPVTAAEGRPKSYCLSSGGPTEGMLQRIDKAHAKGKETLFE